MKLLDWMQHKFRQTNNEPSTEFAPRNSCSCLPGQPSFDDIQIYPKSHYYAKTSSKAQREGQFRKSFTCIETAKQTAAEEEESAAVFSELFHGFLAIGTLAAETVTNEPKTPTFSTYNIEEETEPTEDELKLIKDELEKVLEPEGRESGAAVCPLQDYLFGSVIELSETVAVAVSVTAKKEKEHRTSLGELFQRTKAVEEVNNNGSKIIKTEKIKEKETEKSAVCLMKKILKRRTYYSSSKHSTGDKKPSRKILQMFHRKVHPEGHLVEPKFENNMKHVTEGRFVEEYKNRNQMLSEDVIFPMVDISKKGANCTVGHMPSGCCVTDSDGDGNRECWIKSDADYLVLEL